MTLAMTRSEREAFLAETHVGVISVAAGSRGPLSVPVWYAYEPGGVVRFVTGGTSRKVPLIRTTGRLSLCAQSETVPYKYVSIEGPAVMGAVDFARDVRALALRYLGEPLGEWYLQKTAAERAGAVLVSVTPERWLTADYSKMG